MTLRYLNQKQSEILAEFGKIAEEKGLVSSVAQASENLKNKKSLDISYDLNKDIYRLTAGLKEAGYVKEAEELEHKFFIFKNAETHLYRVHDEDGEDLVDFAHQDGDVKVQDAKHNHGDVETIVSQQKKIIDVVNKKPTGKNTTASILNATASALGFKLGQFEAGYPGTGEAVSSDAKREANSKIAASFSSMLKIKKEATPKLKIDSILFTDSDAKPSSPRWDAFQKYSGTSSQQYSKEKKLLDKSKETLKATTDKDLDDTKFIETTIKSNSNDDVSVTSIADYINDKYTSSGVVGIGTGAGIDTLYNWAARFDQGLARKYFYGSHGWRKSVRPDFMIPDELLPDNPDSIYVVQMTGHTYDYNKIQEAAQALYGAYQKKRAGIEKNTEDQSETSSQNSKVIAANNAIKGKISSILQNFESLDSILLSPPSLGVDISSYLDGLGKCNQIVAISSSYVSGGVKYQELKQLITEAQTTSGLQSLDDFARDSALIKEETSKIAQYIGAQAPGKLSEIVSAAKANDLYNKLRELADRWSKYINTVDNEKDKNDAKAYAITCNSVATMLKGGANRPYLFIYAQIKHSFDNLTSLDLLEDKINNWEKNTNSRIKKAYYKNNIVKTAKGDINSLDPAERAAAANSKAAEIIKSLTEPIIQVKAAVEKIKIQEFTLSELLNNRNTATKIKAAGNESFDSNYAWCKKMMNELGWTVEQIAAPDSVLPTVTVTDDAQLDDIEALATKVSQAIGDNSFGSSVTKLKTQTNNKLESGWTMVKFDALSSERADILAQFATGYNNLLGPVKAKIQGYYDGANNALGEIYQTAKTTKQTIYTNLESLSTSINLESFKVSDDDSDRAAKMSGLYAAIDAVGPETEQFKNITAALSSGGVALAAVADASGTPMPDASAFNVPNKEDALSQINALITSAGGGGETITDAGLKDFYGAVERYNKEILGKINGMTKKQRAQIEEAEWRARSGGLGRAANAWLKNVGNPIASLIASLGDGAPQSMAELTQTGDNYVKEINLDIARFNELYNKIVKPDESEKAEDKKEDKPIKPAARPATPAKPAASAPARPAAPAAEEGPAEANDGAFKASSARYLRVKNAQGFPGVPPAPGAQLKEIPAGSPAGGGRAYTGGGGGGGASVAAGPKISAAIKKDVNAMENLIVSLINAIDRVAIGTVTDDNWQEVKQKPAKGTPWKYNPSLVKIQKQFDEAKKNLKKYKRQDGNWNSNIDKTLGDINSLIDSLAENFANVSKRGSTVDENDIKDIANENSDILSSVVMFLGNADTKLLPPSALGGAAYGIYNFPTNKPDGGVDIYPLNVESLASFYTFIVGNTEDKPTPAPAPAVPPKPAETSTVPGIGTA